MFDYFLNNNFKIEYVDLVTIALSRPKPLEITEEHHIFPKSLGGLDVESNLVYLTIKEHVEAHRLLTKITSGLDKAKMSHAYWMMVTVENIHQNRREIVTIEQIEEAKKLRKEFGFSKETCKKIGLSRKDKIAIYNENTDKLMYIEESEFFIYENQGFQKSGRPKTNEHKRKISETNKSKGIVPKSIGWNTGLTKETSIQVAKISDSLKGNIPWNKGKSGTGFGNLKTNPMKDPEKIKKMLETRKRNKQNKC